MGGELRTPELYGRLTPHQQEAFGKEMIEKLRTLIGGYGELSVLAEYIQVMLQSSRPREQIETELEAFLQDQSRPFTNWLCNSLAEFAGAGIGAPPSAPAHDADEPPAREGKRREKVEKGEKVRKSERNREKRAAANAAAAAAKEAAATARNRSPPQAHSKRRSKGEDAAGAGATTAARSRSRPRRRAQKRAAQGDVTPEVSPQRSRRARIEEERKAAVLTPNVQFLRDAYHKQSDGPGRDDAPPPDTRWHFRAEGPTQMLPPPAGVDMYGGPQRPPPHAGMPPPRGVHPHQAVHAMPVAAPTQPVVTSVRPRFFQPKKWKVVRAGTVVRATESLSSPEVQTLQEGEIVEQVSPHFTLQTSTGGIVRIQIRHPSSPQFPNPIGWVTQDATAAGGPKFLEPGPEPIVKTPPNSGGGGGGGKGYWDGGKGKKGKFAFPEMPPQYPEFPDPMAYGAPPGKGFGKGFKGGGKQTFQNLTWTPNSSKSESVAVAAA